MKHQHLTKSPNLSSTNHNFVERKHRTGIFGKSLDLETILKSEKKDQNIDAVNHGLAAQQGKSEMTSQKILPKVKFVKHEDGRDCLNHEPQSGRDSGIEIGCENPELLYNTDSEIDRL